MVPADNPVSVLVNEPVPLPSEVVLFAVVGFGEVLQHTPRIVTEAPPSLLMFPPLEAVVPVIEDIAVVVRVGIASVVKRTSFP